MYTVTCTNWNTEEKEKTNIQAYNILHKIDKIDPSNFYTQTKYEGTRSHSMKIFKPWFESELRKYAFSQRIIENWNLLTDNIVSVLRHLQM